ncbi:helix-turn-helix domain-containing protein [Candidatus Enterococcus ikei]|uniref:Helix-turn-helix domain-containing protein n=1 Tax=Candidatus Enterococcus ikei TaxID=2815326 RepID=A0ABS3GX21_9ENTE|nr:helix-turn-helix domain-containing protein [Enterococcus sp. DIV0869a]MBO0439818.1 helix-turn-helix domain-containing protein [Enterococcus sp. DIV0869a]
MKLFISDIDNRKIEVLAYLIKELKEVKISDLVVATGLSDKTVRGIVLSLKDNPYLDETKMTINYNENGNIISIIVSNISLADAAFFYLEKSVIYIMIKELFLRGYLDKNKICTTNFISEATFTRYKNQLKNILQTFHFTLSKENVLIGDEYRIRNFYFLFFSFAHSKWFFSEESYSDIERSLSTSFFENTKFDTSKKSMVCLLVFICKIRNTQGFYVDQKTPIQFKKNGSYERVYKGIANYINTYCPYFKNKAEETQFLFLFSIRGQLIVPNPYLEEEMIIDIDRFENFKETRDYLVQNILSEFFDDDNERGQLVNQDVTMFLLYVYFSFIDSRKFLYVYDEENYYSRTNYEKELLEKIKGIMSPTKKEIRNNLFFKEWFHGEKGDVLINQLFLLVYSLVSRVELENIVTVRVHVQISKVYVADILKAKIKQVFAENVELVNFCDESTDLIVSDKNYSNHKEQSLRIYVPTFSDAQYFDILCETILKEITKKISQNKSW